MNASASSSRGFVVHCRHGHCDGRDRLLFVRQMLEQGWLTVPDLTDSRYLSDREYQGPAGQAEDERPKRPELLIGSDAEIAGRVARDLIQQFKHVVHDEGEFWRYANLRWEPIPLEDLWKAVFVYDGAGYRGAKGEPSNIKVGKSRVESVIACMAPLLHRARFFADAPTGINCASGFITFETDGAPKLGPHSPEHRHRHVLAGRWPRLFTEEQRQGSLLGRLLNGCFEGDEDGRAKKKLLGEIAGVAALGHATRMVEPKAVVLVGKFALLEAQMTHALADFPAYKLAPVDALIPYARNARTHSPTQVAQIAASIREFGFTNPVLVDGTRGVIAGHGRLLAARQLGMDTVPTIELAHLTEAQKRAYVLADNRLALSAGWDDEMLRIELGDLQTEGFDLALTGFDIGEIEALFATPTAGLTDPDEVPPAPETPVTQPGDIWTLGRHRLICGDSTDPTVVEQVLDGVRPHLMATDPPYGVDYDPAWRNRAGISTTERTGKVLNDHRADWREAWALFPGDVAYVWHGALHASTVAESLTSSGFEIRSQIIWAKERLVMGRGHYHWQHEPCWYAVRGKGHWAGDRKQTTLWSIPTRAQDQRDTATAHGTQKPVECMRRPMLNNSSPGQAVFEPFSGSGTTLIAAEMEGRACHAVELSPAYVDVAVLRWQAFTGQQAVLAATGQTFAAVCAARGGGSA